MSTRYMPRFFEGLRAWWAWYGPFWTLSTLCRVWGHSRRGPDCWYCDDGIENAPPYSERRL